MKRLAVLAVPVLACAVLAACGDSSSPGAEPGTGTSPTSAPAVPEGAQVLKVPGTDATVFATREEHPRGGFQVHVFVDSGKGASELTDDGAPIVPFVATDVTGPGSSADCAQRAIVVRTASPLASGDLRVDERRFEIGDGAALAVTSRVLAASVNEAGLARDYPQLARRVMFAHC